MTEIFRNICLWVDDRLHVSKLFAATAGHHVPKSSGSWFYVFGSMTLLCFMIQVVTGTLLAFVYVPSGSQAYETLMYLSFQQPLGWYLRGLHFWGSNFMVGIMCLHMTQVFLFGAYKYPREVTWISGCILMIITLGLAFTGQVMRFDEDAYWGLGIGAAIMGRVPFIGEQLVHLMLGGPIISSDTLSRFFSLHVFILPGSLIALVSLHLRMVLTKGINEYPKPGQLVRKETYEKEYAAIIKKEGVPFFPKAISKDLVASAVLIFVVMFCAAYFGPKMPNGLADPTQIDTLPRPDFYFLWIFAVAALLPDYTETFILLVSGPVILTILFALPFINATGEKSWRRRPVAVMTVIVIYVVLGILTYLGHTSPWSPHMDAWSSVPTERSRVVNRTPLELQGLVLLQNKQCRNCHAIDGIGGHRGPDLMDVGARLNAPQLTRQIVQGGGNMPAYGNKLVPYEIDALVAYMVSLRPPGVPAARMSTVPGVPPKQTIDSAVLPEAHKGR
mgnify:CR=1 FL=1|jgi:ubiquinol-cytochrome c reductase cytochrome b subunit